MVIRKATAQDFDQIIPLLWIVCEDMELPIIKQLPKKEILGLLQEAMQVPGYRYNYEHILVAEIDTKIVGIAVSYLGAEESDQAFDQIASNEGYQDVHLFTTKEAKATDWYLDTLVVDSNYRGQGIATKLIEAICKEALGNKVEVVGLNVDEDNEKAHRLYERLGFKYHETVTLSGGHQYQYLQKKNA